MSQHDSPKKLLAPGAWLAGSAITLIVSIALLAGCGSGSSTTSGSDPSHGAEVRWVAPARPISGLRQRTVGRGPRAAVVLWGAGGVPSRDIVIFLHSWEALPPSTYAGWMRHLVSEGNTIVYPVYQESLTRPARYRANTLAGIATALRSIHADPDTVVAIGSTTGGALAFDYAAVADSHGLPAPRGVLAIYPGRNPGNGVVAPASLSLIPSSTLLEVIVGPGDPIPDGEAEAKTLLSGAQQVPARQRMLTRAEDRQRYGPLLANKSAQRSFWAPADRLIAEARRG